MLQEMTEEWEQCDRKLKETLEWIEKSAQNLNSVSNKRRPLRDQLALRERVAGEIASQRTKTDMSLEKLQIHFTDTDLCQPMSVNLDVRQTQKDIQDKLDDLAADIKDQMKNLEACLVQLDQYQQVENTFF